MGNSAKTHTGAKGLRLAIGAYLVTIGVTILITLIITFFLMDTHSCSSVSRALTVLAGTNAGLFLASVGVVGIGAWKAIPGVADRLAIILGYAAMMLATYVVFTCGLMVVFNC
jgi:hypothetical protein